MTPPTSQDLARAVRNGCLEDVVALLASGLGRNRPAELGLGLAMACFLGHRAIVRELVRHGAPLNLPAGLADASPLAMAVKGGQKKTVQLLIALGTQIPAGFATGLSDEELAAARAKAKQRRRKARPSAAPPATATPNAAAVTKKPSAPLSAERPRAPAASTLATDPSPPPSPATTVQRQAPTPPSPPPVLVATPAQPRAASRGGIVEEIDLVGCYGVDTNILESEMLQYLPQETPPVQPALDAPEIAFEARDERTG